MDRLRDGDERGTHKGEAPTESECKNRSVAIHSVRAVEGPAHPTMLPDRPQGKRLGNGGRPPTMALFRPSVPRTSGCAEPQERQPTPAARPPPPPTPAAARCPERS